MSNPSLQSREWISASEAARAMQLAPQSFKRIVDLGKITVRKLPGARPVYLASDVAKLIQESTQKATS